MTALEPHYVSVNEAAAFLALKPRSIYTLLDQQAIESRYFGSRRLVVLSSLREYADNLPAFRQERAS